METPALFDSVIDFLEADGWHYRLEPHMPNVVIVPFNGRSSQWLLYIHVREQNQQLTVYSVSPIYTPTEKLQDVAEFITRANYGMIIGNFELDYSDGEVRYKTSIDVEGDRLSFALIKQMVYANVIVMDRYLPGIMQAIYSFRPPEEIVIGIEAQPMAPPPRPSQQAEKRTDHKPKIIELFVEEKLDISDLDADESDDQD